MKHSGLRFEVLNPSHVREGFNCGVQALDDWFRTRAGQDQRRHVAQVFVALDEETVIGFYSLSMFSLALESIPPALARKLPRYDAIPAALIGRLAIAKSTRGTGLGSLLLADAISRVLATSTTIAAYAIVIDSKNDSGTRFYEANGFIPFPSNPRRLFLMTETAKAAAHEAGRR